MLFPLPPVLYGFLHVYFKKIQRSMEGKDPAGRRLRLWLLNIDAAAGQAEAGWN